MVEVPKTHRYFDGMAGSRMPVSVAHGEGRAEFSGRVRLKRLRLWLPAFRG
jgi:phosphoribosylformylglycinamidine synthase